MLAPEVAVPYLAALGEGLVVVFEAVDGAVVGYADEEGAAVAGVGEAGDGLDGGVLDEPGLVALLDVPAEAGFVFDHRPIALRPHPTTTALTDGALQTRTDHHHQRFPLTLLYDPCQLKVVQAYRILAYVRRNQSPPGVLLPRMSLLNSDYGGPLLSLVDYQHPCSDPLLPPHFRRAVRFRQPSSQTSQEEVIGWFGRIPLNC